jgi:tRNA (guanine-N(7)-)-methyltransferase
VIAMPARRSVFADRLLEFPELVFGDGRAFQRRGRWREHFGARVGASFDGRVIFEIGCNDAGLLAAVAAKHPATAFVGVDWRARALHAAAERVAARGLDNVALLHGRAQDIQKFFADGELDEIWIFHPEPLDNPREIGNRLIAEPFLRDAHAALHAGGLLALKTDHPGYFDVSLELLARLGDRFDVTVTSRDFWIDGTAQSAGVASRPFAGEITAFESRFIRKRKPIYFALVERRVRGDRADISRLLDRTSDVP